MKLGTEVVDMFWLAQMRQEHAEFARQRDLLAEAIRNAALEAGIINDEVPLDGPQLLMVLDDMAQSIQALMSDNAVLRRNSDRYVWLRDKSEAVHSFYLSVANWFKGVTFSKETVDAAIDSAMASAPEAQKVDT